MNIKDFTKPVTAARLNENLAKKFGKKIDLDRFTTEQLYDARNKLRTKLSQVETNESFESVHKESYQKNKMFLDVLNAALAERDDSVRTVREGKENEAELVMAAKDMVDRITSWMEDTAEMQTESMLELADAIRDELGDQISSQFVSSVKPALETLYQNLELTRETLTSGVGMLTGEQTATEPMGAEDDLGGMDADMDMGTDTDLETDTDMGMDDDFGADAAAAGGNELAGREKRESRRYSRSKKISEQSRIKKK